MAEPPPLTAFAWRQGLVRPTQGRLLAGVCAALARATNTDPILWRVVLAVLSLFGGVGILAYLLGWLLLPSEGDTATPVEALVGRGRSGTSAVITVIAGVVLLISVAVFVGEPFRPGLFGAILLGGALLLLLRDQRGRPRAAAGPVGGPGPWPSTATPVPSPSGAAAAGPAAGGPPVGGAPYAPRGPFPAAGVRRPAQLPPPYPPPYSGPPGSPYGPPPVPPYGAPPGGRPPKPPKPPKPPRSRLFLLTFSVVAIVMGVMALLELALVSIPVSAYFAAALTIVGLGLVIGAWFGRARGLIALGIILAIALGSATGADEVGRRWEAGDVRWTPTSVTNMSTSYRHEFGDAVLDLRQVDFSNSPKPIEIDVSVDVGSLDIRLPDNVDVTVDASVDVGDATVFGDNWGGLGTQSRTINDLGPDGAGGGVLHIDARVDVGNLEVSR